MTNIQKFLFSALAIVAAILGTLALLVWLFTLATKGSDGPFFVDTAGGVFNKHIEALVDEDWEKATSYLHGNCGVTAADLEETFTQVGRINSTQWEEFLVFKAGDNEAFVYFLDTGGLQYMTRHDGQWLVNCGAPKSG